MRSPSLRICPPPPPPSPHTIANGIIFSPLSNRNREERLNGRQFYTCYQHACLQMAKRAFHQLTFRLHSAWATPKKWELDSVNKNMPLNSLLRPFFEKDTCMNSIQGWTWKALLCLAESECLWQYCKRNFLTAISVANSVVNWVAYSGTFSKELTPFPSYLAKNCQRESILSCPECESPQP